jgi:hypothetical protein
VTRASGCDGVRQALGVYLIGAIHPAERALVDGHLAACRGCREQLAGLAALPALLGRVDAAEATRALRNDAGPESTRAQPSSGRLNRLAGQVARTRRRRRWALAGAVIVAVTCAAAGGAALWPEDPPVQPPAVLAHPWSAVLRGFDPWTRASAAVRYGRRPWGTALEVRVAGIRPGTTCQFWVTDSRGHQTAAGGWMTASSEPGAWYPISTPAQISSIRSVEVTTGRTTLVSIRLR